MALLDKMNQSYLQQVGHQPQLESSIASMEVAFRMQTEAPEVFDITKEAPAVRARYGFGTLENPLFPGVFERAATAEFALSVVDGRSPAPVLAAAMAAPAPEGLRTVLPVGFPDGA